MSSPTNFQWKRPTWSIVVAGCVGSIVILLASCGGEKEEVKARAAADAPAVSVVVAPVVQKTVPLFTELTARTDATDTVDIRARVKAFLQAQSYAEGTMVKAGQVLFTLDKREYEAQLMQAQAQLARAEADLAQAQEKSVVETGAGQPADCYGAVEQDGSGCQPAQASGASRRPCRNRIMTTLSPSSRRPRPTSKGRQAALNTSKVNQTASISAGASCSRSREGEYSAGQAQRRVLQRHVANQRDRRNTPGRSRQSRWTR